MRLDAFGLDKEGVSDGRSGGTAVVPYTSGTAALASVKLERAFVAAFQSNTAFLLLAKVQEAVGVHAVSDLQTEV